jgi:site-specific DNA recombinase
MSRALWSGRRYRKADPNRPASGVWLPCAVNVLVSNPVYKGDYLFGRRSASQGRTSAVRSGGTHHDKRRTRPVLSIAVPALVSTATWDAAQAVMHGHLKFSPRNAHREYLLRGLMKCGACGMGYVGDSDYYTCYGKRRATLLWGAEQAAMRRCTAMALNAADIEADVWADVDHYLRHPDDALALIAASMDASAGNAASVRSQVAALGRDREGLQAERDTILTYHAKGRMTERDLDRQLDRIAGEERDLAGQHREVHGASRGCGRGERCARLGHEASPEQLLRSALVTKLGVLSSAHAVLIRASEMQMSVHGSGVRLSAVGEATSRSSSGVRCEAPA